MSARKAEQVLEALKTLLETVPQAVVERNSMLPEKSSSTAEINAGDDRLGHSPPQRGL